MKLVDLFEMTPGLELSEDQLENLISNNLCYWMYGGDEIYMITDVPNSISRAEESKLLRMSFSEWDAGVQQLLNHFERATDLEEMREFIKKQGPGGVTVWPWKEMVAAEKEMYRDVVSDDDFAFESINESDGNMTRNQLIGLAKNHLCISVSTGYEEPAFVIMTDIPASITMQQYDRLYDMTFSNDMKFKIEEQDFNLRPIDPEELDYEMSAHEEIYTSEWKDWTDGLIDHINDVYSVSDDFTEIDHK